MKVKKGQYTALNESDKINRQILKSEERQAKRRKRGRVGVVEGVLSSSH